MSRAQGGILVLPRSHKSAFGLTGRRGYHGLRMADCRLSGALTGGGGGHALARLTAGLLFSDDFNRADGAPGGNWSNVSGTWVISSNALTDSAPGNFHSMTNTFSNGTGVYEAKMRAPTAGGYAGLRLMAHSGTDDFHQWVNNNGASGGDNRLGYGGSSDGSISNLGQVTGSTYHVVKVDILAPARDFYVYLDRVLRLGSPGSRFRSSQGPTTAGTIGFWMYSSAPLIDYVLVYSSTIITVTGLTASQAFRIFDGSHTVIGSSATQSSGTATIDIATLVDGLITGTVEVYDTTAWGTLLATYPSAGTATDICGGDSYSFS
jgi:hypothetical protein